MKKRREFLTKMFAGAMSAAMVVGTLPVTAMAASSPSSAKDGTYTGNAAVVADTKAEFKDYQIEVGVTIRDGKITDVAFTENNTYYGEGATRNEMLLNPADSEDALKGLKDLIIANNGTDGIEASIDNGSIDAISGATCSAYAILDAVNNAISNADEAVTVPSVNAEALNKAIAGAEALKETDYTADSWSALQTALTAAKSAAAAKESQEAVNKAASDLQAAIGDLEEKAQIKYITMNVPYEDFYAAYDLDDKAVWEVEPGIDAVSTATTSKFMGSTAKGTYNDGKYILGVKIPVAVDADAYAKLNTALSEGSHYYFTDLDEQPDAFSTLTVNEDGTYSFSKMQNAEVNTKYVSIGEIGLNDGYGDYQFDLEGFDPSNGLKVGDREYIDYTVYGVILNTADGKSYGMTSMENIWNGSRFPWVQVAWSIEGGQGLQRGHGSGGEFYQFDMNGKTLSSVTVITNYGVIDVSCGEDGLVLPEYYTGDLSALKYSITNDAAVLNISGIPDELGDVTVTVSDGLATEAKVVDGRVALTGNPVDGTNYTITINSSNFPGISRTVSTPISDSQKDALRFWIEKANAIIDTAANAEDLKEHVEEAEEMLVNEDALSYDAAVLIGELTDKVKSNYKTVEATATLKGNVLNVALEGVELMDLDNPTYTLSYSQRHNTVTLTSGDLSALSVTLDAEPTVGQEYTLTIVSDNYQDIAVKVTAEEAVADSGNTTDPGNTTNPGNTTDPGNTTNPGDTTDPGNNGTNANGSANNNTNGGNKVNSGSSNTGNTSANNTDTKLPGKAVTSTTPKTSDAGSVFGWLGLAIASVTAGGFTWRKRKK